MSRPRQLRKIVKPPAFRGYKPYGTHLKNDEVVELLYEEYEAIKLADYDCLTHLEASKLMGVSRATFARIYDSARKKVAKTLVEVKTLKTVFGNTILDDFWFLCSSCSARYTLPNYIKNKNCPLCNSDKVGMLNK